jgi:hypothetical protein
MRVLMTVLTMASLVAGIAASGGGRRYKAENLASLQTMSQTFVPGALRANSLCGKTEHVIFSCRTKNSAKQASRSPGKIVSLCASPDLDRERGYLQYRYGLPGKVELEFPQSRVGTQQKFRYTHYFRYQVDLTEISFNIDGYEYSLFDDYNGEEKPAISTAGVSVRAPGKDKEVSFVCLARTKTDYSALQEVLPGVE